MFRSYGLLRSSKKWLALPASLGASYYESGRRLFPRLGEAPGVLAGVMALTTGVVGRPRDLVDLREHKTTKTKTKPSEVGVNEKTFLSPSSL